MSEQEPMRLFAFVRRRENLDRDEFLRYWHDHHGPLIRDTPGLGDRLLRYEQHPAHPNDRSGWDGVAFQEFRSWDDFIAMISGPEGEAMRADEANFLDPSSIKVVFTEGRVVIVDGDAAGGGPAGGDAGTARSAADDADLVSGDDRSSPTGGATDA